MHSIKTVGSFFTQKQQDFGTPARNLWLRRRVRSLFHRKETNDVLWWYFFTEKFWKIHADHSELCSERSRTLYSQSGINHIWKSEPTYHFSERCHRENHVSNLLPSVSKTAATISERKRGKPYGVFVINPVFMCVRGLSIFKFKLENTIDIWTPKVWTQWCFCYKPSSYAGLRTICLYFQTGQKNWKSIK